MKIEEGSKIKKTSQEIKQPIEKTGEIVDKDATKEAAAKAMESVEESDITPEKAQREVQTAEKEKLNGVKSASGGKKTAKKELSRKAKIVATIAATTALSFIPQAGEEAVQGKGVIQEIPEKKIEASVGKEEAVDEKTAVYTEEMKKVSREIAEGGSLAEAGELVEPEVSPEEALEAKEAKKEFITLSTQDLSEEFEKMFARSFGDTATLKNFNIVKKGDVLNISVQMNVKHKLFSIKRWFSKGKKDIVVTVTIGLSGNLVNKGDGLGLENVKVTKAPLGQKEKVEGEINKSLSFLLSGIKEGLEEKYDKKIDTINIDDSGNLKVSFKQKISL